MLRNEPFHEVDTVGLMLGRVDGLRNHVGFLYLADDKPLFLHLGWHFDLRLNDISEGDWSNYVWVNLQIEDEENRIALAAVLSNIWSMKQDNIPYGFSYSGEAFNPDGSFNSPPVGQGLTCATFVVKALASAAFELLLLETWQDREGDAEWREFIIHNLRHTADEQHIEALQQDATAVRVRPEDVVAAGISSPWPRPFDDVDLIAKQVLEDLYGKIPM